MTLWNLCHFARRILRGPAASQKFDARQQRLAFVQSQWLVRVFYLCSLIVTFELGKLFYDKFQVEGLPVIIWPIFWVQWAPDELAVRLLVVGLFAATILAVLFPHIRWVRVAFFVLFLMSAAGRFADGYIPHYLHYWMWLSLIFIFFPVSRDLAGPPETRIAKRHVAVSWFFAAQVMIAFFYSLSGFWKVLGGLIVSQGRVSSFAPDALPSLVLVKWFSLENPSLLAEPFLEHMWLGWPLHLAVIYFELFAIVAVFRPEMHRLFGAVLVMFHMSVWLLMGIIFPYQPFAAALVFIFSPYAVGRKFSLSTFLYQLPLFGDLAAYIKARVPRSRVLRHNEL